MAQQLVAQELVAQQPNKFFSPLPSGFTIPMSDEEKKAVGGTGVGGTEVGHLPREESFT